MGKPSAYTRCTAQRRDGGFCDDPSLPDAPFPICLHHAGKLYGFLRGRIDEAASDENALETLARIASAGPQLDAEHEEFRPGHSRVYYVGVGDLIKIGYTSQINKRMGAYPPDARLLVTEPGGADIEARRHRQFQHLLAERKEWFRPGPELLNHINLLRLGQGSPALATP